MPQSYVVKVERDTGWLRGATWDAPDRPFRHWALAPEMGGRFPQVGDYVQFRELQDGKGGRYISEVRKITPPTVEPYRTNVYVTPPTEPGIKRIVAGQKVPLDEALAGDRSGTEQVAPGITRVLRTPRGPRHAPVDLTLTPTQAPVATPVPQAQTVTVPTTTIVPPAPTPAPQPSTNTNVFDDGHTVTVMTTGDATR